MPTWNKKRTERDVIFIKQSMDLNKVLKNVGFERGFKKEIDEGNVQQSLTQIVGAKRIAKREASQVDRCSGRKSNNSDCQSQSIRISDLKLLFGIEAKQLACRIMLLGEGEINNCFQD